MFTKFNEKTPEWRKRLRNMGKQATESEKYLDEPHAVWDKKNQVIVVDGNVIKKGRPTKN